MIGCLQQSPGRMPPNQIAAPHPNQPSVRKRPGRELQNNVRKCMEQHYKLTLPTNNKNVKVCVYVKAGRVYNHIQSIQRTYYRRRPQSPRQKVTPEKEMLKINKHKNAPLTQTTETPHMGFVRYVHDPLHKR